MGTLNKKIEKLNLASLPLRPKPYMKTLNNKAVPPVKFNVYPPIEQSVCDCKDTDPDPCGYTSFCFNRQASIECKKGFCNSKCKNQLFRKHFYPKMKVFRTTGRGWGLKTLEDIKSGHFVIELVGEVIDSSELDRRIKTKHENGDKNFYFMKLDKNLTVDAESKGNLARFMNHSCEPNCRALPWTVDGKTKIGIFSLLDIEAVSIFL